MGFKVFKIICPIHLIGLFGLQMQPQIMLKFIILLLPLMALATGTPLTTPSSFSEALLSHTETIACLDATRNGNEQCLSLLPKSLTDTANSTILMEHPELCCPVYLSFKCTISLFENEPTCSSFLPIYTKVYEDMFQSTFVDNQCNLEKCK